MEGFTENVSIEYMSGEEESWKTVLEKLRTLEGEWEGEGRGVRSEERL